MNIARAMIGDAPIEIRVTGIRPGEKMHEIMVSEEEAHHCVRRGDYFAIQPMLPELAPEAVNGAAPLQRELSSGDNVLTLEDTVALLERHELLPRQVQGGRPAELLR